MNSLVLASASPRRQELLQQIGVSYVTLIVDVDETPVKGELAETYVLRLAREKSIQAWHFQNGDLPVLGADTCVVIDGQILGKPKDKGHAIKMLKSLSGRCHQVITAVALKQGDRLSTVVSVSEVCFAELTDDVCHAYLATGESMDKAGAYAVQGMAAAFIDNITGSYSGVMGLPLFETVQLLKQFKVPFWSVKNNQ
ncbi:MAG: septum formation inhibitor Maf [Gammaproteobacteria bacterium]|nr:septum formation inhibitor Maf [Gammaproteobacteria bacterium]